MTIFRANIICAVLVAWQSIVAGAQEGPLIRRAQRVSVRSLDSAFPDLPFEKWLATLRPLAPSHLQWEVNDCGEGGDGRAAPTCVEASLDLASDASAHAVLVVAGLDGKIGRVEIFMLYAVARGATVNFKRLADWAAYVQRQSP
jgi:hypothetical protein